MLKLLIGVLFLLIPFLLITKFEDKKKGFFYILSFLIAFHLFVAVLTQSLHIFNYSTIFVINLVASVCIIHKTRKNLNQLKKIKIDWVLIFVIIILFIQLYSVHYNYTGTFTTITSPLNSAEHMKNPYPYFSDEWYSVAFIDYSISSKSLPLKNPLTKNLEPFSNLELPFHSFIAEIIISLDLDPLTQYTIITIFSGILICVLVYFILRFNNINQFISAIAAISLSYIINGGNIPGLWNLIPLTLGIIFLLLEFIFISIDDKKMILFTGFFTLIFYPPLFLFSAISLISYFLISKKQNAKYIMIYLGLILTSAVLISFTMFLTKQYPLISAVSYIFSRIFFQSLTPFNIPNFSIFYIIPLPILFFAIFGFFEKQKQRVWLISPIIVGIIYWIFYSYYNSRFLIDYERVVVVTSFLIVIVSGFGINWVVKKLNNLEKIEKYKIMSILQVSVLILFLIISFSYTNHDGWRKLELVNMNTKAKTPPAAPAVEYLQEDDLVLFSEIHNKNFLSIPWKGTVIGIATDNFPITTKPGTISNEQYLFFQFSSASCQQKINIALQKQIEYVYTPQFNCPGFSLKGISKEGLYLYEVLKT